MLHSTTWTPPITGYVKLNFDVDLVADNITKWGIILRDYDGNIFMAGVKHYPGCAGAPLEEARACFRGLACARAYGIRNVIIESDCQELIQMLRNKSIFLNSISLFVRDIIFLFKILIFILRLL